jgi:hypothetical protein
LQPVTIPCSSIFYSVFSKPNICLYFCLSSLNLPSLRFYSKLV